MAEAPRVRKLETIVALSIALITVVGAVIAWRASVAEDGAGDADFAGLKASLNREETRTVNTVNAYEHYSAYTAYWRYTQMGDALGEALKSEDLSEDQADQLCSTTARTAAPDARDWRNSAPQGPL